MKAIEQHFHVVVFGSVYYAVHLLCCGSNFKSVNKTLVCEN